MAKKHVNILDFLEKRPHFAPLFFWTPSLRCSYQSVASKHQWESKQRRASGQVSPLAPPDAATCDDLQFSRKLAICCLIKTDRKIKTDKVKKIGCKMVFVKMGENMGEKGVTPIKCGQISPLAPLALTPGMIYYFGENH